MEYLLIFDAQCAKIRHTFHSHFVSFQKHRWLLTCCLNICFYNRSTSFIQMLSSHVGHSIFFDIPHNDGNLLISIESTLKLFFHSNGFFYSTYSLVSALLFGHPFKILLQVGTYLPTKVCSQTTKVLLHSPCVRYCRRHHCTFIGILETG